MAKILLIIFFSILFLEVYSQDYVNEKKYTSINNFEKGNKYFNAAFLYRPRFIGEERNLYTSLRAGIFIKDRLIIGPAFYLEYLNNIKYGVKSNAWAIGGFARHYILDRKFSPYIEGSLQYGNSHYEGSNNNNFDLDILHLSVTPGLSFKLANSIGLEFEIRCRNNIYERLNALRFSFTPFIGVHYIL